MKVLNTGKKRYEIPFENGEVAVLEFNPLDYLFMMKFQNLEKAVGEIILKFNEEKKSKLGSEELEHALTATRKICDEFDNVFGKGSGDEIFKVCSPISIINVDGKDMYYPFYFISEFMPVVAGDITDNAKKSAEKAKELVSKYESADDAE